MTRTKKSRSRKVGMNVPPFERFEQNYPTWGDWFAQDGDIGYFILRDYDSGKWFGSVENMTTGELIYETGMHVGFIATYEEMREAMSRNRYVGKRKKRAYDLWTGLDGADEVKYNILMDFYFENDAPMWEEEYNDALRGYLDDLGEQIGVEFGRGQGGYYGNIIEAVVTDPNFEPPITIINYGDIYEWFGEEFKKIYERHALEIYNAWVEWQDGVDDEGPFFWALDGVVEEICDRADKFAQENHDNAYDWYVADEQASEWLDDEYMRDIWYEDERYAPYREAKRHKTASVPPLNWFEYISGGMQYYDPETDYVWCILSDPNNWLGLYGVVADASTGAHVVEVDDSGTNGSQKEVYDKLVDAYGRNRYVGKRKQALFGTVDDYMEHIIYKYNGCKGAVERMVDRFPDDPNMRIKIADIWDYVISIAEDAEVLARELGYNGPGVF